MNQSQLFLKQVKPVVKSSANGIKPVQQNLQAWMDQMIAKPAQPAQMERLRMNF